MKKLSLDQLKLSGDRILNRKELKEISGGLGSPCVTTNDCPAGQSCFNNYCTEGPFTCHVESVGTDNDYDFVCYDTMDNCWNDANTTCQGTIGCLGVSCWGPF